MRTLLTGLIAATLAAGAWPAAAAEVSVGSAREAVRQACARTLDAFADGGTATGLAEVRIMPGRFHAALPGSDRTVDAPTGTYGPLSETVLTNKQRKTARTYAGGTRATHWLNAGSFQAGSSWDATYADALAEAVGLADCTGGLDAGPVRHTGRVWTFERYSAVFETDAEGRLVRMQRDGVQWRYAFAAADVQLPASPIAYRTWRKASEAASLNATLRSLTRAVAAEVNADVPSAEAISQVLAEMTPTDRVVALKTRLLRKGSLVHARNPYTKVYFAWRVYLKGGQAVARKVAPLT